MNPVVTLALALLVAASPALAGDGPGHAADQAAQREPSRTHEADDLDEYVKRFRFFPSLLSSVDGRPLASSDFEQPAVCMGCHPELYRQWNGSMHSAAFVDPVFQALWRIGIQETGGAVERLCAGCHTAIGTMAGEVRLGADGVFEASEVAKTGVQCDLCHTITGERSRETPTGEPQNASIVVDPGEVKRGPYADADSPYHDTAFSALHTRSEFCANCHNVFHPSNNFPIEDTYREWRSSVYAQAGIQCQDCHMMPVDKAIEAARTLVKPVNPGQPAVGGPRRGQMHTHEFVGANAAVTGLLGAKDHAAIAVKRLQNAASIALELPAEAQAGRMVSLKVKVRNETAGHNLPTSLTDVRQVWIELIATAGGAVVFESGRLDAAGSVDPDATMFHAHAVDRHGHHTVKPWEVVRFESNTTIPPKGSATARYAFELPADARGPLTIEARLRYRSYDQAVANLLLGAGAPQIPVVDMVAARGEIPVR